MPLKGGVEMRLATVLLATIIPVFAQFDFGAEGRCGDRHDRRLRWQNGQSVAERKKLERPGVEDRNNSRRHNQKDPVKRIPNSVWGGTRRGPLPPARDLACR